MTKTSISQAKKRALTRPITCPICSVKLTPPTPHSCGGQVMRPLSSDEGRAWQAVTAFSLLSTTLDKASRLIVEYLDDGSGLSMTDALALSFDEKPITAYELGILTDAAVLLTNAVTSRRSTESRAYIMGVMLRVPNAENDLDNQEPQGGEDNVNV